MATYQPRSIKSIIDDIVEGKLIIPALQRNFVWPDYKITDLFDSLLRGYPIGTFLFWNVNAGEFAQYSFNKVLTEFRERRDKHYRGEAATNGKPEYCAVLDGQQRITSLAISILGKYTVHTKGSKWDDESSFVDKYLCVNILHKPVDIDDKYEFAFLPDNEKEKIITIVRTDEEGNEIDREYKYWLRVSDIYDGDKFFDENGGTFDYILSLEKLDSNVFSQDIRSFINGLLNKLRPILIEKDVISVYSIPKNTKLNEIVDIFVRVNSGGQKLDDADLILSIASGENTDESFYDKITNAIDDIKEINKDFKCDKKFILSVSLLCIDADSTSLKHPDNYSRESIKKIIDNWDVIIEKIKAAVKFVEKLDFDVSKLSSSIFMPIAYYFYLTDRSISYFDLDASTKDRVYIRQWIFRTMINGVFDEGTGKTLVRMRNLIRESQKKGQYFPLDQFMEKAIKKTLLISPRQADDILDWEWPDYRIVPLLKEISPSIPGGEYTMDHMWPQTYLKTKSKLKARTPNLTTAERDEFRSRADLLPNIQLLTGSENSKKNQQFFDTWIAAHYSDPNKKNALFIRNIIPTNENDENLVDYSFEKFLIFFDARSAMLKQSIIDAFPDSVDIINQNHGLDTD